MENPTDRFVKRPYTFHNRHLKSRTEVIEISKSRNESTKPLKSVASPKKKDASTKTEKLLKQQPASETPVKRTARKKAPMTQDGSASEKKETKTVISQKTTKKTKTSSSQKSASKAKTKS